MISEPASTVLSLMIFLIISSLSSERPTKSGIFLRKAQVNFSHSALRLGFVCFDRSDDDCQILFLNLVVERRVHLHPHANALRYADSRLFEFPFNERIDGRHIVGEDVAEADRLFLRHDADQRPVLRLLEMEKCFSERLADEFFWDRHAVDIVAVFVIEDLHRHLRRSRGKDLVREEESDMLVADDDIVGIRPFDVLIILAIGYVSDRPSPLDSSTSS